MKKQKFANLALLFILASVSLLSCKKDEEKIPRYASPDWVSETGNFPVSMTAVVALPSYIEPYMGDDDKLAAFIDGSCRGVASIVDGNFYILIKGTPEEQSSVTFQYYNARNRYLYQAESYVSFEADRILGTSDEPEVLPLVVKK